MCKYLGSVVIICVIYFSPLGELRQKNGVRVSPNVEFYFVGFQELRSKSFGDTEYMTFGMTNSGSLRIIDGYPVTKKQYKSMFASLDKNKTHNLVINLRDESEMKLGTIVNVISDFRADAPPNSKFKVYFLCPSILQNPSKFKNESKTK